MPNGISLAAVRNLRRKGGNSTSMKTLRETENFAFSCIRQLFTGFPNMLLNNKPE